MFTLAFSTVLMTCFAAVCAILAPQIMRAFLEEKDVAAQAVGISTAVDIGVLALRLQCICMPLLPVNFMASVTYQVVGNKGIAALLSVSRQGLFYIPAVLILPRVLKLFGVQSCQAVSDLLSFLFAIPFTFMFFNHLKKVSAEASLEKETPQDFSPAEQN